MTATTRAVELAEIAAEAAADKLASDIIAYDVSEQLVITDVFLLCSAANDRQVRAIVDAIEEKLRKAGARPVRREGEREGRWVLLDYLDIVVHVQHAEERTFYALERLWKDCPRIQLPEPVGARAARTPAAGISADGGPEAGQRGFLLTAAAGRCRTGRSGWTGGSGWCCGGTGRRRGTWRAGSRARATSRWTRPAKQQAERAARLLAALRPDVIISSDLSRAMATAAPLARLTGLTVTTDKDLRERHGGAWEGLTDVQIRDPVPGGARAVAATRRGVVGRRRRARRRGPGADRRRPGPRLAGRGGQPRRGAPAGRGPAAWPAGGLVGRDRAAGQLLLVGPGPAQHRWRLIEHNAGTLPEPVLSDDR